jgi:hypothetical protein
MDTDTIDYAVVAEKLQRENERLRLILWRMRLQSGFTSIDMKTIKQFVSDNYMAIVVGIMLIAVAMSVLDTIHRFTRR